MQLITSVLLTMVVTHYGLYTLCRVTMDLRDYDRRRQIEGRCLKGTIAIWSIIVAFSFLKFMAIPLIVFILWELSKKKQTN